MLLKSCTGYVIIMLVLNKIRALRSVGYVA